MIAVMVMMMMTACQLQPQLLCLPGQPTLAIISGQLVTQDKSTHQPQHLPVPRV